MTEQTPTKKAVCKVVYKIDSTIRNNFRCGSWFLPIVGIIFVIEAILNFPHQFIFPTENIIFTLTSILMSIFFITMGLLLMSTIFLKNKNIGFEDYFTSTAVEILFFITFIPTFTCIGISLYLIGVNIKGLIFSLFFTSILVSLFGIFIYLSSWCPKIKGV